MNQHKNAEFILAWAEGKSVQYFDTDYDEWLDVPEKIDSDFWNGSSDEYRMEPKMFRVGTILEFPEPMWIAPKIDSIYYVPDLTDSTEPYYSFYWKDNAMSHSRLASGICHLTKEGAIAHARALLSLTKQ